MKIPSGNLYPDSPVVESKKEKPVTQEELSAFLPVTLYFDEGAPGTYGCMEK